MAFSDLSPAEQRLAMNAAQRVRLARKMESEAKLSQSPEMLLPRDEVEALAKLAAPELGMDPDDFGLGPWVAPSDRRNPQPKTPANSTP